MPERRRGRDAISVTVRIFRDAGFETSQPCDAGSSSFELAARREERLVLLRFSADADRVQEEDSAEMSRLSSHLRGSPLVVAERSRREALKPGVVYRRHGIASVSRETLACYLLDGEAPLAFAGPGGLYVRIDGPALGRARLAKGFSLGDVAGHLGVSRRTVQKYEREGMAATAEKALRLEEFLEAEVAQPQDLLESQPSPQPPPGPISDRRLLRLRALGFEVHPATRAPFDAVLRTGEGKRVPEGRALLIGLGNPGPATYRRARITASISVVARAASAFFVPGGEEPPGEDAPRAVFLDEEELEKAEDARELLVRIEGQKADFRAGSPAGHPVL